MEIENIEKKINEGIDIIFLYTKNLIENFMLSPNEKSAIYLIENLKSLRDLFSMKEENKSEYVLFTLPDKDRIDLIDWIVKEEIDRNSNIK